jgi:hypothetical protein
MWCLCPAALRYSSGQTRFDRLALKKAAWCRFITAFEHLQEQTTEIGACLLWVSVWMSFGGALFGTEEN